MTGRKLELIQIEVWVKIAALIIFRWIVTEFLKILKRLSKQSQNCNLKLDML